jgi:hypothetical protein
MKPLKGSTMEEKKYQIFVSSTYKDLIKARENIFETILKLYHFPVGMEMFSADDDEQWEVIKDTINISDYYVLIIGHRYGTETSEGLSYTEKEYDYAKSQNIPVLAFIRNRDVATKPHERDDNSKSIDRLKNFIAKASKSKMCDFWENEDDLSTKIAIALPKIFRKNPRIGWVRANMAISPEVSEELAKLSSENRELRTEKEQLKALIDDKKPDISIEFNDKPELEFVFVKKENLEITIHNNKFPFSIVECPKSISIESVPQHLKPFLSSSDIDKYNDSLPSREVVDEHNELKELYFRIKQTSAELCIVIENFGISKANDVFIDIGFPKEVLVMDKYDIKEYEHPDSPIPQNPIKSAEGKYKKEQERRLDPFSGLARDISMPSFNSPFDSLQSTIANMDTNNEIHTDIDKYANKVTIRVKSLLHTRKVLIDDYAVIPLKLGQFEIQTSVICEEYSEAKIFVFPVTVEEPANN